MSWKWCYENNKKDLETGWKQINGLWYYFNYRGIMQTGWVWDSPLWYYCNESGAMETGWIKIANEWFYLEPKSNGFKGSCYIGRTAVINGVSYSFDSRGAMIEGLVSDKCVDFVKSYEGFFPDRYICPAGVPTIGYGTTKAEYVNQNTCTEKQATAWLKEEIESMAIIIKNDLDSKGITLKTNEFDSLCSFAYNCGTTGLLGSTLYRRICAGVRDSSLEGNFTMWSKANGKTLQGLLNRRKEEYQMFANADYTRNL